MSLNALQNSLSTATGVLNALAGSLGNKADAANGEAGNAFAELLNAAQNGSIAQTTSKQTMSVNLGGLDLADLNIENGELPSLDELIAALTQLSESAAAGELEQPDAQDLETLASVAENLLSITTALTGSGTEQSAKSGAGSSETQALLAQTLAATKSFVKSLVAMANAPDAGLDGELGADFKALIENVSARLEKLDSTAPVKEQLRQTIEEIGLIKDALGKLTPKAETTSAETEALLRSQNGAKQAELAQKNGLDAGVISGQKSAGESETRNANSVDTRPNQPNAAPANVTNMAQNKTSDAAAPQYGSGGSNPSAQTNVTASVDQATAAAQQQVAQGSPTGQFAAELKATQDGSAPQRINLPAMAFEITRQVANGNNRFQIRLDPPELGRIDVRMDTDINGNTHARLTVERPETLDMLTRDARALERALQQAGLDGQKTSLEFSLKQNGSGNSQGQQDADPDGLHNQINGGGAGADDPLPTVEHTQSYRGFAQPGGLNLVV